MPKVKEDSEEHTQHYLPANYAAFVQFFKFLMKFLMVVLGLGFGRIRMMPRKKRRHKWAYQVMNKMIENASMYRYSSGGKTGRGYGEITVDFPFNPSHMMSSSDENLNNQWGFLNKRGSSKEGENYAMVDTRSPILIAASKGITEMVDKILENFPVAIQDVDAQNKNVILLAAENGHYHTFKFLIERKIFHESVFHHLDNQGNNALHLAAKYGHYRPWIIPGSALMQMQWELKWYKFVRKSMAKHRLADYNNKRQTPKQVFTETHKVLVKDAREWLTKTSESCSFIATIIATVAFATATNVPGGFNQESGKPVLGDDPAFGVFAISSFVALCFSIIALVTFLAIITSRFEEKDFDLKLPRKLILGLTSLFTSIVAMLVSFCAGHFFELKDKLKFAAFPIYTAACLPISFFALAQLPLYFDLFEAFFKQVS
ncbi:ankyrin repeat-containing protein NPR4-like [Durio zibethinus]|uniref:Ankyrin repeat-containing protein NPR4-like n=1 Tax=Durio zibethinus TaxID=66656 RepID=A0A6P5X223_DURZI|nr:ankyrin repeat-containing protein NPR4-like [Durio zibethinus]